MIGRSTPVRVLIGVLIVALVVGLSYFGTRFALGSYDDKYRFTVVVGETGQGLVSGSDVVARGVIVGKVGQITLTDDLEAQVEVILEPRYRMPEDATFAVIGKTLFGEKQFEIRFDGDRETAAAYIDDGALVDTPDDVVEVQDVLEELDDLLGAIDPDDLAVVINDGLGTFVGQEDAIARSIDQGVRGTDVFARSLDDQTPTFRDLSLVAEALGPVGDEFNRLGQTIDGGALRTISDNQDRLRVLLDQLVNFSDELDTVLELSRPQLDRMIVSGDNVTRVLFAYRPELADMVAGLNDYTDTIGNGGQTSPGFEGFAAGFQIILSNPVTGPFCSELPPELGAVVPACAATPQAPASAPGGRPVFTMPAPIDATPTVPQPMGLDQVFGQLVTELEALGGADR